MIVEIDSEQKLATCVANTETGNVGELRSELAALTEQAMGMASDITSRTSDLNAIWDNLLPVMSEVQKLLSKFFTRRQDRLVPGLPTWEAWQKTFLRDSGLNVCGRTAERRMKAFRELAEPDTKKTATHSHKITSGEIQKMLQTQRAAQELDEALHGGRDPSTAVERVLSTVISAERLREMIANSPMPRAVNMTDSNNGLDAPLSASEISHRLGQFGSAKTCELDFERGGVPLLAEYLTVEHSAEITVVFGSLSLAEKHAALKDLFALIAETVIHMDDAGSALQLPGEGLTENREPLQAA